MAASSSSAPLLATRGLTKSFRSLVALKDHESSHPDDQTIPIFLSGPGVRRTVLDNPSLLDLAPTALWALGLEPPAQCAGRVLHEAFVRVGAPEGAEPVAAVA